MECTILGRSIAEAILNADPLIDRLPHITAITRCPVLLEHDGHLIQIAGYDPVSGIHAAGQPVPKLPLKDAINNLNAVLGDFHFASPPDRSRALAAIITPALVFGGNIPGRAPAIVCEADKSQTGKGYLVKVIAAIYRDTPATIADSKGGVGSIKEKFDAKVIEGRSFISWDNLRGHFDCQSLESFLTEPEYTARIPYGANMQIDPCKTIVLFTSNKAQFTEDFANRSTIIRLRKHPKGHVFTRYPEGEAAQIDIPGFKEDGDIEDEHTRLIIFRAIGKRMSECVGSDGRVEIEGFLVERLITTDAAGREIKEYRIEPPSPPRSSDRVLEVPPNEDTRTTSDRCPEGIPQVHPEQKPLNPECPQ